MAHQNKEMARQLAEAKRRIDATEQQLLDVQQELLHSRSFVQKTDSGDLSSFLTKYQSIEDDIESLAFQLGDLTNGTRLFRYKNPTKLQGTIVRGLYDAWFERGGTSTDYISCAVGYLVREALVAKIFRPFLLQKQYDSSEQDFSLELYQKIATSRKLHLSICLSCAHYFLYQMDKSGSGGGERWSPKRRVNPNLKSKS